METTENIVQRLGEHMTRANLRMATAESCTGGWIAKAITDVPGSSAWFDHAIVSYSNESKSRILGVPDSILRQYGAVSEQTVTTMLSGILANPEMNVGVAVSGIAGPDGGTVEKPVGTVYIAWGQQGRASRIERFQFNGDREQIRMKAVKAALNGLLDYVQFD